MGLSGAERKTGGSLYLHRLVQPTPQTAAAALGALATAAIAVTHPEPPPAPVQALAQRASALRENAVSIDGIDAAQAATLCSRYLALSPLGKVYTLPGPTCESNRYRLLPRGTVWAMPQTPLGRLHHLAAALASGNVCCVETAAEAPVARSISAFPQAVQAFVRLCTPSQADALPLLGVVLFEGMLTRWAQREGANVRIATLSTTQIADRVLIDLTALVHEQSLSTNTTAAGGNAQRVTLGDHPRTARPATIQQPSRPAMHTSPSAPPPLGAEIPHWTPPPSPARQPHVGQFCTLEPADPQRHSADLFAAYSLDAHGDSWTYLPYGPFATQHDYATWMQASCTGLDPLFFTIVDRASGKASGLASYLRITPAAGSIEIGHLAFSPLLQRKPAATEALYLLMREAFALGYRRLEWKCNTLNAASRQEALRLGFAFEGVFRQATVVKGRNRDTAWFSIIDSEWTALDAAFRHWLTPGNFDDTGQQRERLSALTAAALGRDCSG